MTIREQLFEMRDEEYAAFTAKIAPSIKPEDVIGVRMPQLRLFGKKIAGTPEAEAFLSDLPHKYYDENMLHSVLLSMEKTYEKCVSRIDAYLPFVDNWAACDTLRPKVFAKHHKELISKALEWASSSETYTCRYGVDVLMSEYLGDDFSTEYLERAAQIESEEYYVRMMVAWYFATALAKQWDATIPFIEEGKLPRWTHNKTIQKARESYRITPEQKEYLKTLKR